MSPLLTPGLTKEVRALFPAWIACSVAVAAGSVIHDNRVLAAGILAYALGSIALGAQSMGHEYTHRTLGMLLAQPADRRRLLLIKFAVLATMLATLTLIAWGVFSRHGLVVRDRMLLQPSSVLLLAALWGLFVAPYLTMVCRSALAGLVFTVAAPMLLLILGDILGVTRYGLGGGADVDRFKLAVLWWGTFAVSAIAAVGCWRMFLRLEAIEGRGSEIEIAARPADRAAEEPITAGSAAKRHPIWLLTKKELRLQQMSFVIVGLYAIGWGVLTTLEYFVPEFPSIPLGPMTLLYFALLAVLIGSLASAEERQLGTLDWQMLLPMPAWQQWGVKAGMTLGLALALGVGVPATLLYLNALGSNFHVPARSWREIATAVVLLTTCSLYISSLCSSGVKAVVVSLPAALGALVFMHAVSTTVQWILLPYVPVRSARTGFPEATVLAGFVVLAAVLVVLLVRFAFVNHRWSDRSRRRLWAQVTCIAALLALGGSGMGWLQAVFYSRGVRVSPAAAAKPAQSP